LQRFGMPGSHRHAWHLRVTVLGRPSVSVH
jgi:hypothetical protein